MNPDEFIDLPLTAGEKPVETCLHESCHHGKYPGAVRGTQYCMNCGVLCEYFVRMGDWRPVRGNTFMMPVDNMRRAEADEWDSAVELN